MYHSFLIHLSADGHLGCFHALAIINNSTGFLMFVVMVDTPSFSPVNALNAIGYIPAELLTFNEKFDREKNEQF